MKRIATFILVLSVILLLMGTSQNSYNQNNNLTDEPVVINGISVPGDFLFFTPSINGITDDGNIFISNYKGDSHYIMILENDGSPLYYKNVKYRSIDFKVQQPGLLSRHSEIDSSFILMDSSYNEIDTFRVKGDYTTDFHDFIITEDNTALMIGRFYRNVDMSEIVDSGNTNALILDNVIQEQDSDHNIIFEWRASDHFDITDAYLEDLTRDYIDYVHINSVAVDFDGHLLIANRHMHECTKINRNTGEIIWRLGGINNQFQFVNEDSVFIYQHDFQPVPGKPGNYTIFDNGYRYRRWSRVVEYKIDTAAMTAEKVWEYRHDPDYYAPSMGNAQRLPNGNTMINWNNYENPKAMEVTPEGEVVYQGDFDARMRVYRTFRFDWNGAADRPYLLIEQSGNIVRLIFNIFGRDDIDYYNIYGDVNNNPVNIIATSDKPWYDIALDELPPFNKYYFQVTAVDSQGQESKLSNSEIIYGEIEARRNFSVLGSTTASDINDPAWTISNGPLNNELLFDGLDDYVNCGNPKSLQFDGSDITIEAWINPGNDLKNSFIVNKLSGDDNIAGYALRITDDYAVEFILGNGSAHSVKTESNSIQLNNRYHLAASYNGEEQKIFINGEEKINQAGQFTFQNAVMTDLYVGSSNELQGDSFNGNIDEVRIWNTTRTPEEIQANIDIELTEEYYSDPLSGLAGYWQFNEGDGQITKNHVGDNNLIINSGFIMGTLNWDLEVSDDASALARISQGSYHAVITDGGSSQTDIVFNQASLNLIEGKEYTLEFDARADSERFIFIKFYNPVTPWIDYGKIGAAYISPLTERFTYSFIMTESTDDQVILAFNLGGDENDIYFDNIILTEQNLTNTEGAVENYPETFSLYQNYPNPFNSSTIITYSIPESSHVIVNVYNILGELINTPVNEIKLEGIHKIEYQIDDLSSGIYLYTLESKSTISSLKNYKVNKMIYLK